jgi:hypothetical protein
VNPDAWPTPSEGASREPLPRVEDLPVAEQGYDQESVKAAFDSFYRHAAQLDAALRTLEAVDSFHRQAAALRADLRTLRSTGWTQQSFSAPPAYGYDTRAPREGVSPAVWRILGEVVFLIAVSVLLGVAKLDWWVIVSVMGGAFLIVVLIEWAASRDRWSAAAPARMPAHPVVEAQPATEPADEGEPIGWAAFEQAQEPSDAMTMIGGPHEAPAETPAEIHAAPVEAEAIDGPESEPVVTEPVHEASPLEQVSSPSSAEESGPPPTKRWWRRRAVSDNAAVPASDSQDAPRHVRVLSADEEAGADGDGVDPWEQGFDPQSTADAGPDEDTGEDGTPLAAEAEPSRRRFRRR